MKRFFLPLLLLTTGCGKMTELFSSIKTHEVLSANRYTSLDVSGVDKITRILATDSNYITISGERRWLTKLSDCLYEDEGKLVLSNSSGDLSNNCWEKLELTLPRDMDFSVSVDNSGVEVSGFEGNKITFESDFGAGDDVFTGNFAHLNIQSGASQVTVRYLKAPVRGKLAVAGERVRLYFPEGSDLGLINDSTDGRFPTDFTSDFRVRANGYPVILQGSGMESLRIISE